MFITLCIGLSLFGLGYWLAPKGGLVGLSCLESDKKYVLLWKGEWSVSYTQWINTSCYCASVVALSAQGVQEPEEGFFTIKGYYEFDVGTVVKRKKLGLLQYTLVPV